MNILFTINREYIEHMKDCIWSIAHFSGTEGYDIYIMYSDLQAEDEIYVLKNIPTSVKVHFIYVNPKILPDFPETSRYPIQVYYRIFAYMLLPATVERILYLDADTLVINSLNKLYNMDFAGNYILACTHTRKILNKINQVRLGIKDECAYINSGVMLMNLSVLREEQNYHEIITYIKEHKRMLILPDQDIITALYGEKIGILDTMVYNLSDRILSLYNADFNHEKRDLKWVRENTVVIHYYGKQKPWNKKYRGILDVFYHEIKSIINSVYEKENSNNCRRENSV